MQIPFESIPKGQAAEFLGEWYEKQLGNRRRQQGTYFTPRYLTEYTGMLLVEHYFRPIGIAWKHAWNHKKHEELLSLAKKFAQIRILDPACGAGAFLAAALRQIRTFYEELMNVSPDQGSKQETVQDLFGSNSVDMLAARHIYGIDLDPVAVELAVAALKVETGQTGDSQRQQPEMDINSFIVCSDFLTNGLNPLKIQTGITAVIGNPPYINLRQLRATSRSYYDAILPRLAQYTCHTGYNDLFYYFLEQGLNVLEEGGGLFFITTNYFLQNAYAGHLRRTLTRICEMPLYIDFGTITVFKAGVQTAFYWLQKCPFPSAANPKQPTMQYILIKDQQFLGEEFGSALLKLDSTSTIKSSGFEQHIIPSPLQTQSDRPWTLAESHILAKIECDSVPLSTICHIMKGSSTGANHIFILPKESVEQYKIEPLFLRKYVKNSEIRKFRLKPTDHYLLYITNATLGDLDNCPHLMQYLNAHRTELEQRNECRKQNSSGENACDWRRIERPREKYMDMIYARPQKLVVPFRSKISRFALDDDLHFGGSDTYFLTLKADSIFSLPFLMAILNSELMEYYFALRGSSKGDVREYFNKTLEPVPIRRLDTSNDTLTAQYQGIHALAENLHGLYLEGKQKGYSGKIPTQIAAQTAELNQLIYELYGINEKKKEIQQYLQEHGLVVGEIDID